MRVLRTHKNETNVKSNRNPQLIDFGMSARFQEGMPMNERVGTVYTMAPEVLQGEYTKQVPGVYPYTTQDHAGPRSIFQADFLASRESATLSDAPTEISRGSCLVCQYYT